MSETPSAAYVSEKQVANERRLEETRAEMGKKEGRKIDKGSRRKRKAHYA